MAENDSVGGKRKEPEPEGSWPSAVLWTACPRIGQVVAADRITGSITGFVNFIPCKPPLTAKASESLEEVNRFDANMFMDRQYNSRRDVGLVIGLISQQKSGVPIHMAWEDWDAELSLVDPENARQVFGEFQKIVTDFHKANPRRCIAVFCEDGHNLTGYCIVSYLHLAFNLALADVLKMYSDARPPGIFHKPYLEDLYELYGGGSKNLPSVPPTPDWYTPCFTLVPAHGEFALPISRPPSVNGGSKEPPLPAGWTEHWSKTHNKKYYFCKATGKQSWDFPTEKAAAPASSAGRGAAAAGGGGGGGSNQAAAWHILIKHAKSRKPSSWKDKDGTEILKRSVQQAREKVEALRAEILAAPDPRAKFAEIARKESDCSSANKGGDLGTFMRGKMQPTFEKATFDLPVGQISRPVESDSGVHIILRTG